MAFAFDHESPGHAASLSNGQNGPDRREGSDTQYVPDDRNGQGVPDGRNGQDRREGSDTQYVPDDRNGQGDRNGHGDREVSETEIGAILVQVQEFADKTAQQAHQFADNTAQQAHHHAQAVVQAARAEAVRIVDEAREQAALERERAAYEAASAPPPIPPEAITALLGALDEFGATNRALVAELAHLRQALTSGSTTPPPVSDGTA